jgi:hypothetical protein
MDLYLGILACGFDRSIPVSVKMRGIKEGFVGHPSVLHEKRSYHLLR